MIPVFKYFICNLLEIANSLYLTTADTNEPKAMLYMNMAIKQIIINNNLPK